jgi:hypothetical protein
VPVVLAAILLRRLEPSDSPRRMDSVPSMSR